MARGVRIKGPTTTSGPKRPSFVLGSRPPDLYAPRVAPRPQGNILQPPRIKPLPQGQSTRQYGKTQTVASPGAGFGNTGLTGES